MTTSVCACCCQYSVCLFRLAARVASSSFFFSFRGHGWPTGHTGLGVELGVVQVVDDALDLVDRAVPVVVSVSILSLLDQTQQSSSRKRTF